MTETIQDDEDQSLENFFSKKDKSKKPKKKKKTKNDETTNSTQSEQSKGQVDDWNDFEEEKEKDYSSLKIQNLQVMEDCREDPAEEADDKDGEDDEGGKKKEVTKWNMPSGASANAEPVCEKMELPGTQNVVGGKYIPPSIKRSTMMGMGSTSSRKQVSAPDIKSKAAFPTLSAANQDLSTPNKSTDFEVVKRGIKTNEARVEDNKPRLDLGNRYDSLRH